MRPSDRTPDDYLASLDDPRRDDVVALDGAISAVMAGLPRTLYEGTFWGGTEQQIIGYGTMTTFRSDGSSVAWFIVGLALQKQHISVYVSAVEDRQYLSQKYGPDLGKVKIGASSIGFRRLADIDLDKLVALVRKAREIVES